LYALFIELKGTILICEKTKILILKRQFAIVLPTLVNK
jgi:hypothetical protein